MLVLKREKANVYLGKGTLDDEVHVNPEHIACVSREVMGTKLYRYTATTVGGATIVIDESGYERIVAWMESRC